MAKELAPVCTAVSSVEGDGPAGLPVTSRICGVCTREWSKYICPRCNAPYCSLDCYKAHSDSCTEEFYKEHVSEELQCDPPALYARSDECCCRHRKATPDERKRMMEILQREHDTQNEEDEDADADLATGLEHLDLVSLPTAP